LVLRPLQCSLPRREASTPHYAPQHDQTIKQASNTIIVIKLQTQSSWSSFYTTIICQAFARSSSSSMFNHEYAT
jgi:hypothetical protein